MKITRENILMLLFESVTEFKEYRDNSFDEEPLIQLGFFGRFLREKIDEGKKENEYLLERGFNFLNQMAKDGDAAVEDILGTEVFLGMYTAGKGYVEYARQYLSDKALDVLEENIKQWVKCNK